MRAATNRPPAVPHPAGCSRKRDPDAQRMADDFEVADVPINQAVNLPGGRGVAIAQLSGRSAAAQAGLKIGDVILRVGREGIRSQRDLSGALQRFKMGDSVPILVRRTGFDFWTAFTRR